MRVGRRGRRDHLVLGRVEPAVQDVLADRAAEQRRLLRHEPDLAAQAAAVTSRMSMPSTRIVPDVTSHRRGIRPTSVVLPDPDGPTRARVSPAGTVSEMSRRTGRSGR